MFSRLTRRKKSMGNTVATAEAKVVTERHQKADKKQYFLDFIRKSRRKKKFERGGYIAHSHGIDEQSHRRPSSTQNENGLGLTSPDEEVDIDTAVMAAPFGTTAAETSLAQKSLTEESIRQIFSGAPQFSATTVAGRLRPCVSFPWDFALNIRDVSDSKPIPHGAFSSSTLQKHIPIPGGTVEKHRISITYDIGVVESPCMLAATGNEPGTVGIGFFLQESEADILNLDGNEEDPKEVFENFSNFELLESQPEKLGLRKLDFTFVVERLAELSKAYESTEGSKRADTLLSQTSSGELFAILFGKVLISPKHDSSVTDPTGLKVQIEALVRVLNLKRVWYDFSNVEWRIRVGQLIFRDGTSNMSDSSLSEPEDGLSERDVVMLQLLLACELYTRLEAVASLSSEEVRTKLKLTASEMSSFRELESRKTRWDLVLAQRFLENVEAKTYLKSKLVLQSQKSLARSFFGMSDRESTVKVDELDIVFEPRRQDLYLDGLFHFAAAIDWPDRTELENHLSEALSGNEVDDQGAISPSIYATPLSTPGTLTPRSFRSNHESGYFGIAGSTSPEMTPRSFHLQPPSIDLDGSIAMNDNPSRPSIGGWLTRSYLTGLIMPGEAICHLLISSILENDAESIAALGENANLYGGFVYGHRSFWSKSCILGRVLACCDESRECMGWVSSSVLPVGVDVGWIDVYSTPIDLGKPEVNGSLEIETDLLAGKEIWNTDFIDLTLPQDQPSFSGPLICFDHLHLKPTGMVAEETRGQETAHSPTLVFTLKEDDVEPTTHNIPLSTLVQFVSAFPCTPPNSSVIQRIGKGGNQEGSIKLTPAHPLHFSYCYRQIHVTELLDPKFVIEEGESKSVIVVDARGSCVLELLARAWCSSEGLNAVIARVGVTCLGCAVREARGLNVKVLIRVGDHDR